MRHTLVDTLTHLMAGDPPAVFDLNREVARADSQLAQIAAALATTAALIEGARWPEAAARLRTVDSLDAIADRQGLLVASIGRRELLARQSAVEAVTEEVLRDAVSWLVLGLVLLWFGVVAIRVTAMRSLKGS